LPGIVTALGVPALRRAEAFDLAGGWGSIDIAQFVSAFLNFAPPKKRK